MSTSFRTAFTAVSSFASLGFLPAFLSSSVATKSRLSATIVLRTVFGQATLAVEPTARNSNLLPVKAKGEVRLRSLAWRGIWGRVLAPRSRAPPDLVFLGVPLSTWSRMSLSMSPRKMLMIAGGASLAPRRWSFAGLAIDARSRSARMSTARITAARNTRNCMLLWVSSRGSSRLTPVSVAIDQLLCLPLPLIPAKGFSWSRHSKPCERATARSTCMVTIWWSTAMLAFSKVGAISYWLGATSLWRVFTGTPSSKRRASTSAMKARTRSGTVPK